MQWNLSAKDRPDSGDIRTANRSAHLEWIAGSEDHVVRGGPYLSDDGETMLGSLILVDFPDRASVEAWAAEDPYARAGLFESVTITAWKKTVGAD
jgi:uncharacterized protein YciI